MVAHTKPDISILELGSRTGDITSSIQSISNSESFHYVLSNSDSDILKRLELQLKSQPGSLDYRILDIEDELSRQGFEDNTFDIIIASNTLYSAQILDKALANVQRLLKPGGKLCIIELTRPGLPIQTVLGCLSTRWR